MTDEPKILYEDDDVLAIQKPAGLLVHRDGKTDEPTLADWILQKYPEIKQVGEPWRNEKGETIFRPGIVHRLDRETSGVILVAKNQLAFEYLKGRFQEREVKKTYRAFVYGTFKNDTGIIDKPIGRNKHDFRKWSAEFGARGEKREAVTEYRVLARGENFTSMELYPKTGRTHQIRVHLKSIGHPIVGDTLYAPKGEKILGFTRTALHAFAINVVLPSGKSLHIEAPLPKDFREAVENLADKS